LWVFIIGDKRGSEINLLSQVLDLDWCEVGRSNK
jgi:hypothetical protein